MIFSFTLAHLDADEQREIVEERSRRSPRTRGRSGAARTTTSSASQRAGARERRRSAVPAAAARATRHADPLLRRRARDGAGRDPGGRAARPAHSRDGAHADAVDSHGRSRVVDPSRRPDPQRRGHAHGRVVDAVVHAALLGCAVRRQRSARAPLRPSTRLQASGRGVAGRGAWWRSISRSVRSPCGRSPGDPAGHPTGTRWGECGRNTQARALGGAIVTA